MSSQENKSIDESLNIPLLPQFTFDTFISGRTNHLVHLAAMVIANPTANTDTPLIIIGSIGLGKSHLLNAIGHSISSNFAQRTICYCPAHKFIDSLTSHTRNNTMNLFRNYFVNVDVLLLDDIHLLAGRADAEEEFLYIFNALGETHKRMIFSSDRLLSALEAMNEKLRSRLNDCLVLEIQPPNHEEKVSILMQQAKSLQISLPVEVGIYLAMLDILCIRELIGLLIKVDAYCSLHNIPITIDVTKEVVRSAYAKGKSI